MHNKPTLFQSVIFYISIIWVTCTLAAYEQMCEDTDENDSRGKFVGHSIILGSQK